MSTTFGRDARLTGCCECVTDDGDDFDWRFSDRVNDGVVIGRLMTDDETTGLGGIV